MYHKKSESRNGLIANKLRQSVAKTEAVEFFIFDKCGKKKLSILLFANEIKIINFNLSL